MTNAVVVWNTLYMQKAIRQMDSGDDDPFDDECLRHLSPACFKHAGPLRAVPLRR